MYTCIDSAFIEFWGCVFLKTWFCLCILAEINPLKHSVKNHAHRHGLRGMPAMISPSHTSKECVHVCVWGMDDVAKGG